MMSRQFFNNIENYFLVLYDDLFSFLGFMIDTTLKIVLFCLQNKEVHKKLQKQLLNLKIVHSIFIFFSTLFCFLIKSNF